MPKSTFFNLPEDKKEKIMDAAINEFAGYSYHRASINRIVEKSGIAKGSFYQYFEDKKDLFKYILEVSGQKKLEYLNGVLADIENLSFFNLLRELYTGGVKFTRENPRLAEIGYRFIKEKDRDLKEQLMEESMAKSNRFFGELLMKGIKQGDIDPDIDVELVAHILTNMSIWVSELFIKELKVEDDMEIMALIDKMLYVIENGIKSKKEGK